MEDLFDSYNGDFDIQKSHINGLGEYVITAGVSNSGILGKTNVSAEVFPAGCITVDMFGNAYYRPFAFKMVTHARVFALKPKRAFHHKVGQFMASAFHFIRFKYGYENMCSWAKIKKAKIQLPTRNKKIDFEFMEAFIFELNAARLAELNAYLAITGLKNYTLTPEEAQVLEDFQQGKVEWGEYRLGDLFEIRPTKAYKYTNHDLFACSGDIPVVTNTSLNNGVSGTVGLPPTEAGGIITYSDTTTSDAIFYQPYPFVGYSHVQGLYPKKEKWEKNSLLYLVSSFRKATSGQFDYGHKFNRAIAKEMYIDFPVLNRRISYIMMNTLISAVQKLVIKDVVRYADRENSATKQIIG